MAPLRVNLASSSDWGRLPTSEDEDETVVHYESDTVHTDSESCNGSESAGLEDN